jgi:tetratricopeptide (TPR) repeat protein
VGDDNGGEADTALDIQATPTTQDTAAATVRTDGTAAGVSSRTKLEQFERSMEAERVGKGAVGTASLLGSHTLEPAAQAAPRMAHPIPAAPPRPTATDLAELKMNVYWCDGDGVASSRYSSDGGIRGSGFAREAAGNVVVDRVAAAVAAMPPASIDLDVALWLSAQYMARQEYASSHSLLTMALVNAPKEERGPTAFHCYFNRAASLAGDGRMEEAAVVWADLVEALLDTDLVTTARIAPSEKRELLFEALANRSWCLVRLGRPLEAIAAFDSRCLDLLDNDVRELTGPRRGAAGDASPVALCLHVLARAYLACDRHEMAYRMFEGAADVVQDNDALWPVAQVWACVAVHAAVEPNVSPAARPEWVSQALDASVGASAKAADKLSGWEDPPPRQWMGVVCRQAACSCWALGRHEEAHAWIVKASGC